jgi:hypothetical protein
MQKKIKYLIQQEIKKILKESNQTFQHPARFSTTSAEERMEMRNKIFQKLSRLRSYDFAFEAYKLSDYSVAVIAINPVITYQKILYLFSQACFGKLNLPLVAGGTSYSIIDVILDFLFGSGSSRDTSGEETKIDLEKLKENDLMRITNLILSNAKLLRKSAVSFDKKISSGETPGAIIGGIELTKLGGSNTGNCYGAWETSFVATEQGNGPLIYSLAASVIKKLEPEGKISPDRKTVSNFAKPVWKSTFDYREDYKTYQFDDISLAVNKRRTPNDPTDDCKIHKPENEGNFFLNYAYEIDSPMQNLTELKSYYDITVRYIAEDLNRLFFTTYSLEQVKESVHRVLVELNNQYFRANYLHKVLGYSVDDAIEIV